MGTHSHSFQFLQNRQQIPVACPGHQSIIGRVSYLYRYIPVRTLINDLCFTGTGVASTRAVRNYGLASCPQTRSPLWYFATWSYVRENQQFDFNQHSNIGNGPFEPRVSSSLRLSVLKFFYNAILIVFETTAFFVWSRKTFRVTKGGNSNFSTNHCCSLRLK